MCEADDVVEGRREFHLEEYKALRAEVLSQSQKYTQTKFLLLAALGAIYSWSYSNLFSITGGQFCHRTDMRSTIAVVSVPPLICVLVMFEARYHRRFFLRVSKYIRKLEEYLGEPRLGWEGFRIQELTGVSAGRRDAKLLPLPFGDWACPGSVDSCELAFRPCEVTA